MDLWEETFRNYFSLLNFFDAEFNSVNYIKPLILTYNPFVIVACGCFICWFMFYYKRKININVNEVDPDNDFAIFYG